MTPAGIWNRLHALVGRAAPPPAKVDILESAALEDTKAKTRKALTYGDLDLDDPAEALRALRRASRTPPHQRHLSHSVEEHLSAYSPPDAIASSPPELRVVKGKSAA